MLLLSGRLLGQELPPDYTPPPDNAVRIESMPPELANNPHFAMEPVLITPETAARTPRERRRAERQERRYREQITQLRYDLYRVYPVVIKAAAIMKRVDEQTAHLEKRRDVRRYIKALEDDLFAKYEESLKKMSLRQGKLMIMLLDRQTGNTAYEIIQLYKSGTSAVFWQLVAKLFGSDLKAGYHPETNAELEYFIWRIQRGLDPEYERYRLYFETKYGELYAPLRPEYGVE